uniref:BTB domain-containing protein n=1 Tax=Timema shepardi TaxID=629360 RepID=A0A7R9ARS4_TIMSH|nr:unnamed protein product [Timema shepardi]
MDSKTSLGDPDVILKVGETEFPSHRNVLAARSPYFEAMFSSNFSERDKNVIEIKGVDKHAMKTLLQSTLTTETDILKSQNVLSLLQAACMFHFDSVKKTCLHLIISKWLTVDTCLQTAATAMELDLHILYSKAMALALWEFPRVRNTDAFFALTIDAVDVYLQNDGLNTSQGEFEVFEAGLNWLEDEMESRAEHTMRILQCVRFVDITTFDLRTMLLYPLVRDSMEIQQLLQCILMMKGGIPIANSNTFATQDDDSDTQSGSESLLDNKDKLSLNSYSGCLGGVKRFPYFTMSQNKESISDKSSQGCVYCVSSPCREHSMNNSPAISLEELNVPVTVSPGSTNSVAKDFTSTLLPVQVFPANTVEAANHLLQLPCRNVPLLPCVVGHMLEETRQNESGSKVSIKSGQPCVFTFDEKKQEIVPLLILSKVTQGPLEPTGYKVTSKGQELFVTGGEYLLGHSNWNRSVWRYNVLREEWGFETSLPFHRRHHSVCVMGDDMYLIGGFGRHRIIMDTVEKYNTVTKIWSSCSSLPSPLYDVACIAHKEYLFVFGQQVHWYQPDQDSWNTSNIATPKKFLNFNRAMSHGHCIYLTGLFTTVLVKFIPFQDTSMESVGDFRFPTVNVCLVGDNIYNFSTDEENGGKLVVEVYDIIQKEFLIMPTLLRPKAHCWVEENGHSHLLWFEGDQSPPFINDVIIQHTSREPDINETGQTRDGNSSTLMPTFIVQRCQLSRPRQLAAVRRSDAVGPTSPDGNTVNSMYSQPIWVYLPGTGQGVELGFDSVSLQRVRSDNCDNFRAGNYGQYLDTGTYF